MVYSHRGAWRPATGMKRWLATGGCGAVGCAVLGGVVALALVGAGVAVWQAQAHAEDALRAALDKATGGEVTFTSLSFGWNTVTIDGVEVHDQTARLARVDTIVLHADPTMFGTERWDVDHVDVTGVHAALRLGPDGWALPPTTLALVQQGGAVDIAWPVLTVNGVTVTGIDATATSADGTLSAVVGSATVGKTVASMDHGLVLTVEEAAVSSIDVTAGEPVAHIATVTLDRDGLASVDGVDLHVTATRGGRLALPPIAIDYAPTWLGGRLQLDASDPWLGISLDFLPWQPRRAAATHVTVDLTDGALVSPAVKWHATASSATAGPCTGDAIPIAATVGIAGGRVSATGSLNRGGALGLDLLLQQASGPAFTPYIQESLDHYGLRLDEGTVSAKVAVGLLAGHFTANGVVTAGDLRFSHPDGKTAITALAANAATGLLGKARTYTVPVRLEGDLDDPHFQPVRAVVDGVEDAVFSTVGGAWHTGRDAALEAAATARDAALDGVNAAKDVAVEKGAAALGAAATGATAAKDAAASAGQKAGQGVNAAGKAVKEKLRKKK